VTAATRQILEIEGLTLTGIHLEMYVHTDADSHDEEAFGPPRIYRPQGALRRQTSQALTSARHWPETSGDKGQNVGRIQSVGKILRSFSK
jgi:hypothetical protein